MTDAISVMTSCFIKNPRAARSKLRMAKRSGIVTMTRSIGCVFRDKIGRVKPDSGYHRIDSHCHLLEMEKKGIDCAALLARAGGRGFSYILNVGIDGVLPENRNSLRGLFPGLLHGVGYSPAFVAKENWKEIVEGLPAIADGEDGVVAVGEIGLDYYWNYGTHDEQKALFSRQLQIACGLDLPVIIHNRDAGADVVDVLRACPPARAGVIHCFSGDGEFARRALDLGFYLSFAGNITYKNADSLRAVAQWMPLDRLLVETDSPYLSPQAVRGETNTPFFISLIYERIAEIRGLTTGALAARVENNFVSLFLTGKKRRDGG